MSFNDSEEIQKSPLVEDNSHQSMENLQKKFFGDEIFLKILIEKTEEISINQNYLMEKNI